MEEYITLLDEALKPDIAATLAGLSLAAVALLISAVTSQEERIDDLNRLKIKDEDLLKDENRKLKKIKKSVNSLTISFYCFVGFLVEAFTLDMWEEKGNFLNPYQYTNELDVALSGGALAVGIYFLTVGGKNIGGKLV